MLPLNEAPDRFLVVTQTEFPGTLLIGEEICRSDGTFLLSLSEHQDLQEAMLLTSASSWIRTAWGHLFWNRARIRGVRPYVYGIAGFLATSDSTEPAGAAADCH
jgi:hypothetical protein